jgi:hypothetical protein
MTKSPMPVPLVFWRPVTSREPVREWLNELSREDKRIIGRDIAKVRLAGGAAALPSSQRGLEGGEGDSSEQSAGADIFRIS